MATIWLARTPEMIWDEDRYLTSAHDLLAGKFASSEWPEIIHGPGYPAFLAPFVAMGAGLQELRFLNAPLMACAVCLMYQAALAWLGSRRLALATALGMMLHPSFLRVSPYLMTEPLALCCLAAFVWLFHLWMTREGGRRWLLLAGATLSLTWLMLTRVIYGQVTEVTLVLLMAACPFWKSRRHAISRAAVVLAASLLLCIPYLVHTARATGSPHCWSTFGSELLYWSSSDHHGDWFENGEAIENPALAPTHAAFLREQAKRPPLERQRHYAEKARENIKAHPARYVVNCLHNISRLAFGYPRSLREQDLGAGLLFIINVPLLLLLAAALALAAWQWRAMPFDLLVLCVFTGIYLAASVLLPALARYGIIMWPVPAIFTAHYLSRHVSLRIIRPGHTHS
jgi:4-amino-4-deoxy-L-arabinose transferase-like glycosyltransferase